MARPATDPCQSEDSQIWNDLKCAIAISSGFQRWQQEQILLAHPQQNLSLDYQVRRYLRETLETLAY